MFSTVLPHASGVIACVWMTRTEWQAFTQLEFMMRSPGSDSCASRAGASAKAVASPAGASATAEPPVAAKTSAHVASADETRNKPRAFIS
jgi:hypothetical protein